MLLLFLALLQATQTDAKQGLRTTTPAWKPPYEESQVPSLLRQKCATDWPQDFTMQETCLKMQAEGALALKDIDDRYGDLFNKQVERCVDDWTKVGVPDFSMIATCSKMQIESYFRLHPPSH